MKFLPDLGKPQHGLAHATGQHVECDQFADGQISGDNQTSTKIKQAGHHHLIDELDAVAGRIAELGHAEARCHVAGKLFFPSSLHLRLDRHRFERFDASDAFHQERLVLRTPLELFVKQPAKAGRSTGGNPDVEGKAKQDNARQQWRVNKHDAEKNKGKK